MALPKPSTDDADALLNCDMDAPLTAAIPGEKQFFIYFLFYIQEGLPEFLAKKCVCLFVPTEIPQR